MPLIKLNKKAVIFDLDGVICFTDKFHYQAWKALALFGDAKGCGLEDYDLASFSDLLNIL